MHETAFDSDSAVSSDSAVGNDNAFDNDSAFDNDDAVPSPAAARAGSTLQAYDTSARRCCDCHDLPSVRDLRPLTDAPAAGAAAAIMSSARTAASTATQTVPAGTSGGPDHARRRVLDIAARLGLHVAVASLPILAIAAHVLGLCPIRTAAGFAVVPLTGLAGFLAVFAPHPLDRIVGRGLVWGVIACGFYDIFRLDTVYLLGYWGDFIPRVGSWVTGQRPTSGTSILLGYAWRYLGDGGGIGVVFFLGAALIGLEGWRRWQVLTLATAFAVFPVWAGLIVTVLLSEHGHVTLFTLSAKTLVLSFIGHVIFGFCMGLGLWRSHRCDHAMFRSVITLDRRRSGVLPGRRARRSTPVTAGAGT